MPYTIRHITCTAAALLMGLQLTACSAPQLGANNGKLLPCPSAPHCVSSTDEGSDKYIAPIAVTSQQQWLYLQKLLLATPRTALVARDTNYLHVVTSTAIMRYKDDIELLYSPVNKSVDVRSSSRIGYYDFEVNRERIETLRRQFQSSK